MLKFYWSLFLISTSFIPCTTLWVYRLKVIFMELVELSTKSLAEAMFEKLRLPKPVYHVRMLEQGGYKSKILPPYKGRFSHFSMPGYIVKPYM
ncbi:hypothetical protein ACQJBY_054443 [Aegilops geniculata]